MTLKVINPAWNLVDPLTVQQAAPLIAGIDPNAVRFNDDGHPVGFVNETELTDSVDLASVKTTLAALTNAIWASKLKVKVVHDSRAVTELDCQNVAEMACVGDWDYLNPGFELITDDDETFTNGYFVKNEPNFSKTMIGVAELRGWLQRKNIRTGFFFSTPTDAPDYLDASNPRYAPRLAAAVRAWLVMEDPNLRRGMSAKGAMEQWLETNYREFGLVQRQDSPKNGYKAGDLNKSAISETAKIANWEEYGGAPKTPVKKPTHTA